MLHIVQLIADREFCPGQGGTSLSLALQWGRTRHADLDVDSKRIYAEDARLGNASAFRTAVKLRPDLPVPKSDLTAA